MARRGTGCLPDVPDPRDHEAVGAFGLSTVELPKSASLSHHVGEVYQQGQTNTCVGWAIANALMISEAAAGLDPKLPSVLMAYYDGRRASAPDARLLFDNGCRPRDAIKALARLGVCDDAEWPWDGPLLSVRKNRRPPMRCYMEAHGRRGGEYARIQSTSDAKVRDVQAALAAGYPVIVALRITDEFTPNDGPDVIPQPRIGDPFVGGHMVTLVGYETTDEGAVRFELVNSWGDGWRDGGMALITDGYLRSAYASSLYVMRGWERIEKARARVAYPTTTNSSGTSFTVNTPPVRT